MLNGITLNEELDTSQINDSQLGSISGISAGGINAYKNADKDLFVDQSDISDEAVNLYQKEQDVKSFTNLALSDPEDSSQDDIVSSLFEDGVSDLFSDEVFSELAENDSLLEDLEL